MTTTIDLAGPACINIKQRDENITLNMSYGEKAVHNATIKIGMYVIFKQHSGFTNIIQNFKNLKLFEPSKFKKTSKFGPETFLKMNYYEKPIKKEERKQPSKTPSVFFFLSSSFVFITHNHLYKK